MTRLIPLALMCCALAPPAAAQAPCYEGLSQGDAIRGLARITIPPEQGFFFDIEIAALPEACEVAGFEMVIGIDAQATVVTGAQDCARDAVILVTGRVDDFSVPTELYVAAERVLCLRPDAPRPNIDDL